MSIAFRVEWEGLDELRRYLATTLPRAFTEASKTALDETADDTVDKAKELVPIDTGALRRSIRKDRLMRPSGSLVYINVKAGGVVDQVTRRIVNYATYVEYGTSRNRPQPFLRPALRWALKRTADHFWRALSKRVRVK